MENKNFNIYKDFKHFDCDKIAKAAGSTKWPKGKRYTVNLNGKEFKIQTYFSKLTEEDLPDGGYDQYEAIDSIIVRELRPDEIMWERGDEPEYAPPEFDTSKLTELSDEEVARRGRFIIAVANLINNQETMEAIVAAAKKKKNGTLHKGRVLKIASTGIASFDSVSAIVARAKSDLNLSVTFDYAIPCKPGDNELWANDFVSTYHDGLLLTKAMEEAAKG